MTRALLTALLIAATGCADAIVFGTGTMVGIEVKPAQDSQTELNFAYSRQEIAVFPRKNPPREGSLEGKTADQRADSLAYSVYAWFRLSNRWAGELFDNDLNLKRGVCIRQLFATGQAAKNLAKRGQQKLKDPCQKSPAGDDGEGTS